MKGYYKNWHQHYIERELQKEEDLKVGYYTNLSPKKEDPILQGSTIADDYYRNLKFGNNINEKTKKKNKGSSKFGILLPLMTFFGFVFLWYQLDMGPVREYVNLALIFVGIRDDSIDVLSYHSDLLDRHSLFSELVFGIDVVEGNFDLDELELLYSEIRQSHSQILNLSHDEYMQTMSLWALKISSTSQLMNELRNNENVELAVAQFEVDQRGLADRIRAELNI